MMHTWKFTGSADANPMGVEWFGVLVGLGFVLSFGYWCTNFLVVQRAMAAGSMIGCTQNTPDRGHSQDVPAGPGHYSRNDCTGPDQYWVHWNCPLRRVP